MTKNMPAGRELDAIVAEKVMGDKVDRKQMINGPSYFDPPAYSTDIEAAWEVVEKMQQGGWNIIIDDMCDGQTWQAHFERDRHEVFNVTHVDTAPHAICLASLKAVGHTDKKDL